MLKSKSLGIILAGFLTATAFSQTPCKNAKKTDVPCNGISVGAPKVFDNRSLTLMMESLSQQLSAQQKGLIDQKTLVNALANIQGLSQRETSTALSVTGPTLPGREVKTDLKTGNVDANGNRLPNTLERTTDTSQPSVTPQAPALDSFATLPSGFNPNFGSSSSDLLSDQVNLTYQIVNLQMLLERALSDRLQSGDTTECRDQTAKTGCNATRLQAILGFNVSIDPPRTANDAVAVVEINISSPSGASLVALMPQEKTYNAAALSSKSNAFGAAAAVNVFQVGFSARKRGQVFYLYRDTDTLSYQRMDADGSIVFGWMFRPVLGRRSVSPGLKQMFSIISLPNIDCKLAETDKCTVPVKTTVRSYWKKFDHGTETAFRDGEANRATRALHGLTFGLTHPEILDDSGHENDIEYSDLKVHSTHEYQRDLSPVVDAVEWYATGAKSIVVSATGNNFFSNTQVSLGDKIFASPADGLILKSNQAFDLITNLGAC